MAYAVPAPYSQAIRSGLAWWTSATATLGAEVVAEDLRPTGGSVTDTTRPGVRRTLNFQLPDTGGLYDKLSPAGTRLSVTTHIRYTNRQVVDIPMGLFVVDQEKLSEGDGALSITAPDKWALIQWARFIGPASSTPGLLVVEQIAALIRGALGASEPVTILATSQATVGELVWEKDRDKAIIALAASIGAWVFFDRDGVATIADIPAGGGAADWLIDAGSEGVLIELDRERSRSNSRNVVVVSSSATDGELFPTLWVWDDDPTSPTFAGTDPVGAPETAGPFGIAVEYFDTPILDSYEAGYLAGRTILARKKGLASQASLGSVPIHALDAFDAIDVLPPGWRTELVAPGGGLGSSPFGVGPFGDASPATYERVSTRTKERHVADTVTHPLIVGGVTQIDGRSTRIDDEGGS